MANNTTNSTTGSENTDGVSDVLSMITLVANIVIIPIAVIGNVVILFLFCQRKELRVRPTNILIATLCLADICHCLLVSPWQLIQGMTQKSWELGGVMCGIYLGIAPLPVSLSVITVMYIAADRYRMICRPYNWQLTPKSTLWCVLLTILALTLWSSPIYIHSSVMSDEGVHICAENWASSSLLLRLAYSVATICLQFLVPLGVTCVLYSAVVQRMKNRPVKTSLTQENLTNRVNRVLLAIIVVFLVAYTPIQLFSLYYELMIAEVLPWDSNLFSGQEQSDMTSFYLVDFGLKALPLLLTAVHPILYGFLNANFRQEMRVVRSSIKQWANNRRPVFAWTSEHKSSLSQVMSESGGGGAGSLNGKDPDHGDTTVV